MTVEEFFEIFLQELKINEDLRAYYKFLNNNSSFGFRKAYFIQRLQFVADQIKNKEASVWDCGCGFGTTALFLAMNGIASTGSTLEFYYEQIENRKNYWRKYGNVDLFTANYENIFDKQPAPDSFDYVILQDTLHHLEPIHEALNLLQKVLKPNGKLIAVEANGNCIYENVRLFLMRGNKKVVEMWDETLQKNILLGNENIRSLKKWKSEIAKHNLKIDDEKTQYIRFYMPFSYSENNMNALIEKEQRLWRKNNFLKQYFFFGLNFVVNKI